MLTESNDSRRVSKLHTYSRGTNTYLEPPHQELGIRLHRLLGILSKLLGILSRLLGILSKLLGILNKLLGILSRLLGILDIPSFNPLDRFPSIRCNSDLFRKFRSIAQRGFRNGNLRRALSCQKRSPTGLSCALPYKKRLSLLGIIQISVGVKTAATTNYLVGLGGSPGDACKERS